MKITPIYAVRTLRHESYTGFSKLYEYLELPQTCTTQDIRDAYRRLVKIHHPDAGGDKDQFANIALAHEVLTDPQRRSIYDQTGQYSTGAVDNDQAALLSLVESLLFKASGVPPLPVPMLPSGSHSFDIPWWPANHHHRLKFFPPRLWEKQK